MWRHDRPYRFDVLHAEAPPRHAAKAQPAASSDASPPKAAAAAAAGKQARTKLQARAAQPEESPFSRPFRSVQALHS